MKLLVFILATLNPHSSDEWLKKVEIDCISGFPCQILDLNFITSDSIIGEWTLCTIKTRNSQSYYYVCPIINFNNNGMGRVKFSLGEDEMFNWKLRNDTIYIQSNLEDPDRTFGHDRYIAKYEKKKEFEELELRNAEADCSYFLRRVY